MTDDQDSVTWKPIINTMSSEKMAIILTLFTRTAGLHRLMTPPRDRRRLVAVLFSMSAVFLFLFQGYTSLPTVSVAWNRRHFGTENSTLGFEKIIAVSAGLSWRLDGLFEAADRTGIDIEAPLQPEWTTEEVDLFRGVNATGRKGKIGPGQAKCWLGHLNVLHEILVHKWSTALIMEDDADWDVMVKQQLAMVAPMIRQVTNSTNTISGGSPYGDQWDLLWLGHCGELTPTTDVLSQLDESLPNSPLYRQAYGDYTYFSPQLRLVHRSQSPVCTYAYAVTASAAMRIYQLAIGGLDEIITIELRQWCAAGILRCVTVNPELFHHHKKAGERSSEIAAVEGWDDLAAPEHVGYTANIRYSARCNSKSRSLVTCQSEREQGVL